LPSRPRVLVSVVLPEDAMRRLKEVADLDVVEEAAVQRKEELLRIIDVYDGAVVAHPPFDREVLAKAERLKIISRHGVGYDTIDVDAARDLGIYVSVTPFHAETVADMAFALILSAARLILQAHLYIKSGMWRKGSDRALFIGTDVFGKTLGIIGLGRIGSVLAKRGRGFDMKVLYYDAFRNGELEKSLSFGYRSLHELLAESDFVSIHIPFTKDTEGLIGEKELRTMKKTAILVNASRGDVVDQEALCRALREGWIGGAALGVFDQEPIGADSPLLTLENVILTPHISSMTKECRRKTALIAVENVIRVLQGAKPLYAA